MYYNYIPGLAACIIANGKIFRMKTYGYADVENEIDVDENTLFMLASVSKTFTATALMQLYENGEFDLDDPVNENLPFTVENPYYPNTPITYRMLLTHTASIYDDLGDNVTGDNPTPLGDFLSNYLDADGDNYYESNYFDFEPGTDHVYSNTGVALAGYLVEEISGMSFEEYCKQNIFKPLGMNYSSWFLKNLDSDSIAAPYKFENDHNVPVEHYGYLDYPSGQLRTSIDQISNFLMAYINGGVYNGNRILENSTIDTMWSNQIPNVENTQGLVWFNETYNGRTFWGHTGSDIGVSTQMQYDPSTDIGVIVLSNAGADVTSIVTKLFEYAEEHVTAVNNEDKLITGYQLSQNYPNPFNPVTNIKYQLKVTSEVNLNVYNVLGKKVAELVDEVKAPGSYEVFFNAENLSSGVYYYRINAGNFNRSRKMLLIK